MPRFVPVDRNAHAGKSWKRPENFVFAGQDGVVPVVAAEVRNLISTMPLAFLERDGGFLLVGMTGLAQNSNLFVAPDGRWLGRHVPAAFRAYPFRLLQNPQGGASIFGVDEDSGLIGEEGEPFFDADKNVGKETQRVMAFLDQVDRSRRATEAAVAALSEAGLITPWKLQIQSPDRTVPLDGLFHVDESAMAGLSDEAYLSLRASGAMGLAYAQILSAPRLHHLRHLADIQARLAKGASAEALSGDDVSLPGPGDFDRL